MAARILRISTKDRATYIDLEAAATHWRADTWTTTPNDDGTITETFEIILAGADSTIRTNSELLAQMAQRVDDWNEDDLDEVSIWFESNSNGEATTVKRSLITNLNFSPIQTSIYNQLLGHGYAHQTCVLTHREMWEDATNVLDNSGAGISTLGGKISILVYNTGSYPGRIDGLRIATGVPDYTLTKIWCGIKELYGYTLGNVSNNFAPLQEAEWGAYNTGATIADATGSNGTVWRLTTIATALPASADWYCDINNNSRLYATGKYLMLGRMKVDAGTVGLQFSYGPDCYVGTPTVGIYRNEMKYYGGTTWNLIELGSYRYPFYDRGLSISGTINTEYGRMALRVQQITGTTTDLRLDCVVLIPSDHMVKADNCVAGSADMTLFSQNEEDIPIALNMAYVSANTYRPAGKPETTFTNWIRPSAGGVVVIAAQRGTAHVLNDAATVSIYDTTRYRSYIA